MKPVTAMIGIRGTNHPILLAVCGRVSRRLPTGVVLFVGILDLIIDHSLSGIPVAAIAADLVVNAPEHFLRLS